MPVPHEFALDKTMSSAASNSKNMAATATGVVVVATTGLRLFRNVPDEHVGVIKHLGRGKRIKDSREITLAGRTLRRAHNAGETYGIKPAGSRRVMPLIQSMVLVSTADNSEGLGHFEFDTADGDQMATEAWMTWNVMPGEDYAWRALYKIAKPEDLGQRIRSNVLRNLSHTLTHMTVDQLRITGSVEAETQSLSNPILENYGVRLSALDLRAPVITLAQKQLMGHEAQANATLEQARQLGRIATFLENSGMAVPRPASSGRK